MKTSELLLTGLDITEDGYSYHSQFTLNAQDKARTQEVCDLERAPILADLKAYFGLDESAAEIKKIVMDMIVERANVGHNIVEGENYEEVNSKRLIDQAAKSLDMA